MVSLRNVVDILNLSRALLIEVPRTYGIEMDNGSEGGITILKRFTKLQ
jgi:hypothetical protein